MRKRIVILLVLAVFIGLGGLVLSFVLRSPSEPKIQMTFAGRTTTPNPFGPAAFRLLATKDCSIFVRRIHVQVQINSGWTNVYAGYVGEARRLRAGSHAEVYAEWPEGKTWRAGIDFGTELKGLSLLRAQIREAWLIHSFSNWTGKPWGGGRWGGDYKLFSDEIKP